MEKEKVNIDVIDDDGRQADNLSTILQRWGYDAALIDTFKSKYLPTLDHLFMVSFYIRIRVIRFSTQIVACYEYYDDDEVIVIMPLPSL